MPPTLVLFYAENDVAPFLVWFDSLSAAVQNKLIARLELLRGRGHELRRPHADLLRDGVYELRAVSQHVNYRILYFFHGQTAVISHGITKEAAVPRGEINLVMQRKLRFAADPQGHTYRED
jgi:hypothetical protein